MMRMNHISFWETANKNIFCIFSPPVHQNGVTSVLPPLEARIILCHLFFFFSFFFPAAYGLWLLQSLLSNNMCDKALTWLLHSERRLCGATYVIPMLATFSFSLWGFTCHFKASLCPFFSMKRDKGAFVRVEITSFILTCFCNRTA